VIGFQQYTSTRRGALAPCRADGCSRAGIAPGVGLNVRVAPQSVADLDDEAAELLRRTYEQSA
jgi:hypothetical protein